MFKLIIAVFVSELAGVVGSVFMGLTSSPQAVSGLTWYAGLVKPALNPPAWVFGPVWITLYFLMGVAAFFIWRGGWEKKEVKIAIYIFGFQLILNALWSVVFFGLQSPGWALANIIALWLTILWTIAVFYKISRPAAYLLVPYILWVSFAMYLNYVIWTLNWQTI